jgi:hypothetical protein
VFFSEPVIATAANCKLCAGGNPADASTCSEIANTVSVSKSVVTITPDAPLTAGSQYIVILETSIIKHK